MKNTAQILLFLICSIIFQSCNEKEKWEGAYPPDTSLAGSICIDNYHFEVTAIYNGIELSGNKYEDGQLMISKNTDDEINLLCLSTWNNIPLDIYIPKITLSGKPYDVTFVCTSCISEVSFNNMSYKDVYTTINGWIKQKRTRTSPATPQYECEINIKCVIDNKTLSYIITAVRPWSSLN